MYLWNLHETECWNFENTFCKQISPDRCMTNIDWNNYLSKDQWQLTDILHYGCNRINHNIKSRFCINHENIQTISIQIICSWSIRNLCQYIFMHMRNLCMHFLYCSNINFHIYSYIVPDVYLEHFFPKSETLTLGTWIWRHP